MHRRVSISIRGPAACGSDRSPSSERIHLIAITFAARIPSSDGIFGRDSRTIQLTCHRDNKNAEALYLSLGFIKTGQLNLENGHCTRSRVPHSLTSRKHRQRTKKREARTPRWTCSVEAYVDPPSLKDQMTGTRNGSPIRWLYPEKSIQRTKNPPAPTSLDGIAELLGDKAYYSNSFRKSLRKDGIKPVIPGRSNRKKRIHQTSKPIRIATSSSAATAGSRTSGASQRATTNSLGTTSQPCASLPQWHSGFSRARFPLLG